MIEIIYNKEKESAVGNEEFFCIPRNIRQIGQPSADCKIYVEDYVYSYLVKNDKDTGQKRKMAILLGKSNWKDGIFYLFLKSCILVEKLEEEGEYLTIRDEVWGKIYEEMKRYFPGQDVIGWYLNLVGGGLNVTDMIKRIHLTHFGGNDKVLYLSDGEEQDHAFFAYRNGKMEKQSGYYIFYEKNEPMQEYILAKNPKLSVDYTGKPQDRAVNDFRKIIAKKREEKEAKNADRGLHIITAGIAAAVVVLSVLWLQKTPFGEKLFLRDSWKTNQEVLSDRTAAEAEHTDPAYHEEYKDGRFIDDAIGDEAVNDENAANEFAENNENTEKELVEDNENTEKELAENNENTEKELAENNGNTEKELVETMEDTENGLAANADKNNMEDKGNESLQNVMTNANTFTEYTIRPGDTLTSISIRYYGTMSKVDEICKINSMTKEDIIYEGQKILLP